jgi:Na+-transporting NADH:ubiquinone oxidoreductase subunit NqrD
MGAEVCRIHRARCKCGVSGICSALSMTPDLEAARRILLDVEIVVGGQTLYRPPELVG